MSTLYAEIASAAAEVLQEFKQGTVQLRRTTTGAPDPSTPWIPGAPTETTYDLNAAVRGVTKQYIDGTLVVAGDLMLVCSVPAVVPETSDAVIIDGVDYTVKRVQQIPAAGTPVAFRLFVGR